MKHNSKSITIGLAFPELRKHDSDYFLRILDKSQDRLDLIVFPEGFETITPANRGIAPEMISEDANVKAVLKKYVSASKNYNIGVIFGFQVDYRNRLTSGGRNDQYCAFTNPQGNSYIYHKHSTSRFNAFFDSNWSIENNLRTVSLNGIGISICHDSYISLISRLLAKKGADVWVNISYQNVRPHIWEQIHFTRAAENNIISICTLHRNSHPKKGEGKPQKEPYAFSVDGKIKLRDIESDKFIGHFLENERAGKIYFFDVANYKTTYVESHELPLSKGAKEIALTLKENNSFELNRDGDQFPIKEVTLGDYFAPEVLWKQSLKHHGKTTIFIVRVLNQEEWQRKKSHVLRTIRGRVIEFSTAFIFIDNSDSILMAAYRSSNYKDSRIFYPTGFPVIIDERYLKGIFKGKRCTCNISLSDYRNEDDALYYKRVEEIISKIESL